MGSSFSGPTVTETDLKTGSSTGIGTLCSYAGGSSRKVDVEFTTASVLEFNGQEEDFQATSGIEVVPVTGFGQAAYEVNNVELFVIQNGLTVAVTSLGSSLSQLKALARATTG